MTLWLRKKFNSPQYHTPFCPRKTCRKRHHDLVKMLCCRHEDLSSELPFAVKKLIQFHTKSGWNRDSNVPDRLKELRCPVLFLACAFGKASFVEGLLKNNFNPGVTNEHGESCLHAAAKHLYSRLSMMGVKLNVVDHLVKKRSREKAFERILQALTDSYPKILAIKDNNGQTPLHCAAANILERFRFGEFHKKSMFCRFCIQSIITRLLKLEADGILTRTDVLEIVKSRENTNGDSVLHMLARDRSYGFETLKFILDVLFPGKLPDEKNRENKTAFNIAWETNAKSAMELFFSGPSEGPQQQQQTQQQQCEELHSPPVSEPRAEPEKCPSLVADAENAGQILVNIDIVKTESDPSGDSEGCQNACSTGNPFPKVIVTSYADPGVSVPSARNMAHATATRDPSPKGTVTSYHPDADSGVIVSSESNMPKDAMPTIVKTFSLACEVCAAIDKASRFRKYSVSSTSSEESFAASQSSLSLQSPDETILSSPEHVSDNEGSGDISSLAEISENAGVAVDSSAKAAIVGRLLTQCTQRLCEVEAGISETKQLRKEGETALKRDKVKMKLLNQQRRLVKNQISSKEKNLEALKKKEDLLGKERRGCKKKVAYFKGLQREFESSCKKARLT